MDDSARRRKLHREVARRAGEEYDRASAATYWSDPHAEFHPVPFTQNSVESSLNASARSRRRRCNTDGSLSPAATVVLIVVLAASPAEPSVSRLNTSKMLSALAAMGAASWTFVKWEYLARTGHGKESRRPA